jgi:hypothetical protein
LTDAPNDAAKGVIEITQQAGRYHVQGVPDHDDGFSIVAQFTTRAEADACATTAQFFTGWRVLDLTGDASSAGMP